MHYYVLLLLLPATLLASFYKLYPDFTNRINTNYPTITAGFSLLNYLLITALLVTSLGTKPVNATQPLSSLFWPICIGVSDLEESLDVRMRNDLAKRVTDAVQIKVAAVEPS